MALLPKKKHLSKTALPMSDTRTATVVAQPGKVSNLPTATSKTTAAAPPAKRAELFSKVQNENVVRRVLMTAARKNSNESQLAGRQGAPHKRIAETAPPACTEAWLLMKRQFSNAKSRSPYTAAPNK